MKPSIQNPPKKSRFEMPYGWVDPEVELVHRGVTVWNVYKNDQVDECRREYWYTINETACEDDGRC